MLILFQGTGITGMTEPGTEQNQSKFNPTTPQPTQPFLPSLFSKAENLDLRKISGDDLVFSRQIPIEALLSYRSMLDSIKNETERNNLIEKLSEEEKTEEGEKESEPEKDSIDKITDMVYENPEELEIVVSESEGLVLLLSEGKSEVIIKTTDAAEVAEKAAAEINEKAEMIKEGKIEESISLLEKLEDGEEGFRATNPKHSLLEESIEKIEEFIGKEGEERVIVKEGERIAAIGTMENILEKDAKEISENASIDNMERRLERINKAKEVVEIIVKALEDAREKLEKLSKERKKEIPDNFYEQELEDSLKILPKRLNEYIKSLCRDKTITPGQIMEEIDHIIEFVRSDKILDVLSRGSIIYDPSPEALQEELEKRLNEISRFSKLREELENALQRKDLDQIIKLLKEMKELSGKSRVSDRLSEFRERLDELIQQKKDAKEDKKKIKKIDESIKQTCSELSDFLDSLGPFFRVARAIKVYNNTKGKHERKLYLENLVDLIDKLRRMNSIALKVRDTLVPSQKYLDEIYKGILKKKNKMTKKEYENEMRTAVKTFLKLYPDYKNFYNPFHLRMELDVSNIEEYPRVGDIDVEEKSAEWLESHFIKPILAMDMKRIIRDAVKEIILWTAYSNKVRGWIRKEGMNKELVDGYLKGKVNEKELIFFLNKSVIDVEGIEKEALAMLQTKKEDAQYTAPVMILESKYREFCDTIKLYIRAFQKDEKRKEILVNGAMDFLKKEENKKLIRNYHEFEDTLIGLRKLTVKSSLEQRMIEAIRYQLILFQYLSVYATEKQIKEVFELFNEYLALDFETNILNRSIYNTITMILMQCAERKFYPRCKAMGVFLSRNARYSEIMTIFEKTKVSEVEYPIDDWIDNVEITRDKILAYEAVGNWERALDELKRTELKTSPIEEYEMKVANMIYLAGTPSQTMLLKPKVRLLEAIDECHRAIEFAEENHMGLGGDKDSLFSTFKLYELWAKRKLKEFEIHIPKAATEGNDGK